MEKEASFMKEAKMTRYLFLSLNQRRKLMLLRSEGRILHKRIRKGYQVLLYNLNDFYIEVWYNTSDYGLENMVVHKDRSLLNFHFNMENWKVA